MTTERFALTPNDIVSPTWRALSEHLADRLAVLRAQNDMTTTLEATERLRGRIAEIKSILALADERKPLT